MSLIDTQNLLIIRKISCVSSGSGYDRIFVKYMKKKKRQEIHIILRKRHLLLYTYNKNNNKHLSEGGKKEILSKVLESNLCNIIYFNNSILISSLYCN